jgi:hypothetical protein
VEGAHGGGHQEDVENENGRKSPKVILTTLLCTDFRDLAALISNILSLMLLLELCRSVQTLSGTFLPSCRYPIGT